MRLYRLDGPFYGQIDGQFAGHFTYFVVNPINRGFQFVAAVTRGGIKPWYLQEQFPQKNY